MINHLSNTRFGAIVKLSETYTKDRLEREVSFRDFGTELSEEIVREHMSKEKNPRLPTLAYYWLDGRGGAVTGYDAERLEELDIERPGAGTIGNTVAGKYVGGTFWDFDTEATPEADRARLREFLA